MNVSNNSQYFNENCVKVNKSITLYIYEILRRQFKIIYFVFKQTPKINTTKQQHVCVCVRACMCVCVCVCEVTFT